MSVMVYSRLGDVLRARNLSVDDLQRQISAHFDLAMDMWTLDLAMDMWTLDRLTRGERVRQSDMETATAAAAILDVRLDDILIFLVDVMSMGDEGEIGLVRLDDEEDELLFICLDLGLPADRQGRGLVQVKAAL